MDSKQNRHREILRNIIAEVSKVVIGKDEIKEILLVALLSQGHVLIEGLSGTAKTTLARTFAQTIGGRFKRVQGTPDMLPADILGFYVYRPDGSSTFMPGPIFANVVLTDELNRTTPRTQAALLEAMQEYQVTIEKETHRLELPFIVLASQVPYGGAGTSPLTEVQIDRFMFRLWSAFPSLEEEQRILQHIDQISEAQVNPVVTLADILELQQETKKVYVAENIQHYILDIIDRLRHHQDLLIGPSPRGGIALLKGARALAFIQGRDFVIPDDVKRLLVAALTHRLRISPEAEMDKVSPEAIINQVAQEVPVPKEGAVRQTEPGEEMRDISKILPSLTTETANQTRATGEAGTVAEAVTTVAGEAHQETTAEVTALPPQSEEAPARTEKPIGIALPTWQWAVIICALVTAMVMISLGLLSLR